MNKRGVGYSTIFYGTGYGNGFPDESRTIAKIEESGIVKIYVEVSDVGSGGESVMWQIATEALNINENLVQIINTSTNLMMDSGTAAASRQTYNTGNAVLNACKKLRYNINKIIDKEEKINTLLELKLILQMMIQRNLTILGEGYFKASTSKINEDGQGNPYWPYTFCAQRVTINVDTETGKIDILEIVAVNDGGKIINPTLAEGQVEGGCSMGIGYAIMEEVNLDKGKIKNTNFSNYIIPTAPAILNAVYDAINIRFYELPITCEKVLLALKNKKRFY